MADRCPACLEFGHQKQDCPEFAHVLASGRLAGPRTTPYPPSTLQDTIDAVSERMMRYRTFKNALRGWVAESGLVVPDQILALDPDGVDE